MDETYEVIEQPEDKRGGKPAPLVDAAAVAGAMPLPARPTWCCRMCWTRKSRAKAPSAIMAW